MLIDASDSPRAILMTAEGCLPTSVQPGAGSRVVPMLVTRFPKSLHIDGFDFPLHMANETDCLIGAISTDVSQAVGIFQDRQLIPIRLDVTDPFPGPAAAWETLDAVLLDPIILSRISDAQRSALLAGGMTFISTGETKPDNRWPWQHRGSLWVLSYNPAGPVGVAIDESVYGPIYAIATGWPVAVRQQVMGIAVLLVMVTLALLLRPRRSTSTIAIALLLLTSIGILLYRRSLGTLTSGGGDVLIPKSGLLQRDAWVYQRARETAQQSVPWTGWTHPIFGSPLGLSRSQMKLVVEKDNTLRFDYLAIAEHTLAFVRREISPGEVPSNPPPTMPVHSPMSELARSSYLTQGTQITGETAPAPGRWPSVVVTAANP